MNRLPMATIAVLCGGVSACLYLALLLSSPGAMILVYLTQLPLFFAGLWFGVAAAAIAGLSGTAALIPGIAAASWMVMAVINGALAQGLLARFGLAWRPSPDLAQLGLPRSLTAALGLAAAATLVGGTWRFLGINLIIALSVPFCLGGLAVVHAAVRRLPHPGMALIAFYMLAGMFGWPLLAAAALGLVEAWLGLRRRLAPHGVRIDG